jgi:hypothetical protein
LSWYYCHHYGNSTQHNSHEILLERDSYPKQRR